MVLSFRQYTNGRSVRLLELVIGFCRCTKCGGQFKYNWHTYYKCPICKGSQYQRWIEEDPFNEEEGCINEDDNQIVQINN